MTTLATTHDLRTLRSYKIGEKEEQQDKDVTLIKSLVSLQKYYKSFSEQAFQETDVVHNYLNNLI